MTTSSNSLRICVLAALFTAASAVADDQVWSAVVLASNPAKGARPKPVPGELAPFAPKLAKLFGYEQFEILGSAVKSLDGHTERWLVPTQNFWVGANALRENGSFRLHLEFFHDKRRLIETEARLGRGSPLFIRGPQHARGQLLVVFEIRP